MIVENEEKQTLKEQAIEVVKHVISVDDIIEERMNLIANAYSELLNVTTAKVALEYLGQMTLVARELEEQLRKILDIAGCPVQLIRKITPEEIKAINNRPGVAEFSREHNLDTLWNHAVYCYQRFQHAPTPQAKILELTSLFYLIKNVEEIALVTPVDRYISKVKKVKATIEG
jgi:hypothetical protein